MSPRQSLLVAFIALGIMSCGTIEPLDYAQEQPQLDFTGFLDGDLTGWGIFQNRNGKVSKRFRIKMVASWQGDQGRLTEHFVFDDGSRQTRQWELTRIDEHHYLGKANDSVGTGHGEVQGNTMHWEYTIRTQTERGIHDLDYDYWMYRVDNRTLINRATLSKYSIRLGDITVTFQKGCDENRCTAKTPTSR